MNTVTLLLAVLAVEFGGAGIDTGQRVELLVSEAGRVHSQWLLISHEEGVYTFTTATGEHLVVTRLGEPDLSYAIAHYGATAEEVLAIGSVSLAAAAQRIAAIRRDGEGSLFSAQILASSAGAIMEGGVGDTAAPTRGGAPVGSAAIAHVSASEDAEVDTEMGATSDSGDIAVFRNGSSLSIEHGGALVSLSGLRTQSR